MIYDGVITKPELTEDNMLMHWGVKGMRWKKRLKGGYYKGKNKLSEKGVKLLRNINLIRNPSIVSGQKGYGVGNAPLSYNLQKRDNGKANSRSGQEGSRVDAGTAAGRKRALEKALKKNSITRPKSRKKTVASGSASVKRRGKA